jgi:uncharacterized membrane protein YhaH (DUF805 family)
MYTPRGQIEDRMRGNVIGFDPDTNTGAISGHDGNRYDFATQDWRVHSRPRHGDVVDFQAIGGHAQDIYLIEPEYVRPGFWQFYFSPSGRISRSQYWLRFMLPYFVIYAVLEIGTIASSASSAAHGLFSVLQTVFSLVALWPSIAVLVKRIHDRNKSGWLSLLLYVPVVLFMVLLVTWLAGLYIAGGGTMPEEAPPLGPLGITVILLAVVSAGVGLWFFIEFGCLRGTVGVNRFGPDPVR